MLAWIGRMFGAVIGAVPEPVRFWVRDLMNGLYGYLHSIFGLVGDGWAKLEYAAYLSWHSLTTFMDDAVALFYRILHIAIPAVIAAYKLAVGKVEQLATSIYRWALREFALVRAAIDVAFNTLKGWVIANIWRPLDNAVTSALKWITTDGALVLYYITHPAALIDLLWNHLLVKIEREAWTAGELLGTFFLSLVVRNLKRFVILLEDILTAVL